MENMVVAGLDIGSTKVACIIAEVGQDGQLRLTGVGSCPSDGGLSKGVIVGIDNTVRAIESAVKQAELMAGVDLDSVWVGVTGEHIKSVNSSGNVAINQEVTQTDIDRALETAKAIDIPANYDKLHVITQGFSIDKQEGIKNPLGMGGVKLEVQVHIITAQTTKLQDLAKCVEKAGLRLNNFVLGPLASSYAVLGKDEKELGVALIDIGGGTTDVAVYIDGNICHASIIGLGGNNITRDVGQILRSPPEKAEDLKKKEGCALQSLLRGNERIVIPGLEGREDKESGRELLVRVIEDRVEEILSLAMREIKKTQYFDMLGAGLVLTGGTAMMEGMREKAETVFQRPVKIGVPRGFGGLADAAKSPMYSTGIGLCMYAVEELARDGGGRRRSRGSGRPLLETVRIFFRKYF
jgi:cell division protein FtsA